MFLRYHHQWSSVFVALILSCIVRTALAGDASPNKTSYLPPEGLARLVVLRPIFFETGRGERPWLLVGTNKVLPLSAGAFTSVVLAPGTREIALTPNEGESDAWKAKVSVSFEEGRVYFLAVWNEVVSGAGALGKITPHMGLLGALMDQSSRSTSVRFEMLSEQDAMEALKELSYVAPGNERINTP
jgi:hypothetical protein